VLLPAVFVTVTVYEVVGVIEVGRPLIIQLVDPIVSPLGRAGEIVQFVTSDPLVEIDGTTLISELTITEVPDEPA
jgi:hypothetical protein